MNAFKKRPGKCIELTASVQPLTEVIAEDPRWEAFGLTGRAEVAACAALRHLGIDPADYEISVLGTDDARIAALNGDFRGKPAPTNVLSWPADALGPETAGAKPGMPQPDGLFGAHFLGDVALAWDTCAREAADGGKTLEAHVTHLVVHGVLHLLGYDHIRDEDATLMERQESEILGKLGIADPYSEDR